MLTDEILANEKEAFDPRNVEKDNNIDKVYIDRDLVINIRNEYELIFDEE